MGYVYTITDQAFVPTRKSIFSKAVFLDREAFKRMWSTCVVPKNNNHNKSYSTMLVIKKITEFCMQNELNEGHETGL